MPNITNSKVVTGAVAMASTLTLLKDAYLDDIRVHLSAAGGAGTLTVTLISGFGTAYNVLLLSQDMTSIQNLVFSPDPKVHFKKGDAISVVWANSNSRTYGVEFVYTDIEEVF